MNIDELKTITYPYPGLRTFEADEAEIFFGREEHIDDLLVRLQRQRFLGVVGPSGCGKSSLVRAGMIPALQAGMMASAGSGWQVAMMRPGTQPLKSLAQALRHSVGPGDAVEEDGFLDTVLGRGSLGLVEALEEYGFAGANNFLLLVDQFEELFRFTAKGASSEARAFVDLLLTSTRKKSAQQRAPVYVVVTMRSDFLGHCPVFRGLPEALNDSQYLTPRLNREQQRTAIEGPAALFNTTIRPDVVNRILNEMGADPDQLPLMQHLLMRMWRTERRKVRDEDQPIELTADTYREVGGLHGCLSGHAEQTYQRLRDEEQRIAERLFRQLAEVNADSRLIRRPRRYGELRALLAPVEGSQERVALEKVIEEFRQSGRSFLMPPPSDALTDNALIDISHESIIRQWERLKNWVQEENKLTRVSRIVAEKAARWKEESESPKYLLQGVELAEARAWRDNHPDQVRADEEKIITESIKQAEEEVRRQEALKFAKKLQDEERRRNALNKKYFWLMVGSLIVVIFATVAACLGVWAHYSANRAVKLQAERYADNGESRLDDGKMEEALVWFTEAFRCDEQVDPARSEMHRMRLSAVLQSCSKLVHMLQHKGPVNMAEFSRDGRRVVTASADGTARIWDVNTGEELKCLSPNSSSGSSPSVRHASFSPNGQYVVTAAGNTAVVWETANGKEVCRVQHDRPIRRAVFNSDGGRIVTGSADGSARVWNVQTGELVSKMLPEDTSRKPLVYFVAFSPDDKLVVTASGDKYVSVWDVKTGKCVMRNPQSAYVLSAAISLNGDRLVTAAKDGRVTVLDIPKNPGSSGNPLSDGAVKDTTAAKPRIPEGKELHNLSLGLEEFGYGSMPRVSFADDNGRHVLTVGASGARLWEITVGRPLLEPLALPAKRYWGHNPSFSPEGRFRVLLSSRENCARILDEASKFKGDSLRVEKLESAVFHNSAKRIVTVGKDSVVRLWDPYVGEAPSVRTEGQANVNRALLSPDEKRILTIDGVYSAQLRDASGEPVGPPIPEVKDAIFSPNSQQLAIINTDTSVQTRDATTGDSLVTFRRHETEPFHVAFNATGELIVTCAYENTAYLWESHSEKNPRPLEHDAWVSCATFDRDGRRLITTSYDKTAKIWDPNSDQAEPIILSHEDPVLQATFSEDGSRVATVSEDKSVRIWDTESGKPITQPLRHKDFIKHVSFSPDGLRVLTRTNKDVRVWAVTTGELVSPLFKQIGLMDAAFTPDGFGVVTVCSDGTCRWWDIPHEGRPSGDLVQLAQLLSGSYLGPDEQLMPCEADTLNKRWQSLRSKYPGDLSPSPKKPLSWHRQEALDAEKSRQWEVARLHLDTLLADDPDQSTLHFRRAQASSEMGKWKEAIADYSQAIASKTHSEVKEDVEVWYRRGHAHFRLGEFNEALADYNHALSLLSMDGAIWLARSIAHAQLGHVRESQDDYLRALAQSPVSLQKIDFWWASRDSGMKQPQSDKWQAVVADCEALPKTRKSNWLTLRGQGLAAAAARRWDVAAKHFQEAANLKSDDWCSWQGAARAFMETNKWPEAESALRNAIHCKDDEWVSSYLLGLAYAHRSDYRQAVELYSKAMKHGGKGWGLRAERAFASLSVKDYDHAIEDYTEVISTKVISSYPLAVAYNNRAVAYENKADYDKALEDYSKGIKHEAKWPLIRRNRGRLYNRMREFGKAIDDLDEVIRLSPRDTVALVSLGDAHYNADELSKALEDYKKALEYNVNDSYAYGQSGRVYMDLQDYENAIRNYSEAIRRMPGNANYYNARGYAYQKKGNREQAIKDYLDALKRNLGMEAATIHLAGLMIKEGEAQQVEKMFRHIIESQEKLVKDAKDHPSIASHQQDLAWDYENFALLLQLTNRLSEAEDACRKALRLRKELGKNPKDPSTRLALAFSYQKLGSILRDASRPDEEEKAYREALGIYEKLVEDLKLAKDYSKLAADYNSLAWLLATCPAEHLRDPGKAVEQANKAVELAPTVGSYWNTLGVARYRAGDWKGTVEALNKSMSLTSGGSPVDWLFLAMAHQQLSDHEQARRWYDKAIAELDKDLVMDPLRRLFRAEAAALLNAITEDKQKPR